MSELAHWILDVLKAISQGQRQIIENQKVIQRNQEKLLELERKNNMAIADVMKKLDGVDVTLGTVKQDVTDLGGRIASLPPTPEDTTAAEARIAAQNDTLTQISQQIRQLAQPATPPATA